jgi:hypothetical protein
MGKSEDEAASRRFTLACFWGYIALGYTLSSVLVIFGEKELKGNISCALVQLLLVVG